MKCNLTNFWLLTVLALSTLTIYVPAHAEHEPFVSTADSGRPDSTGAYWKLRTDYKTRLTSVQFFTAQHQLIYEEKLPGRYVRLTRRNVRLFDELLDALANRRLLDTRIESRSLMASNTMGFKQSSIREETSTSLENAPHNPDKLVFTANSAVTDLGKMVIYCTNPTRVPLYVSLTDDMQLMDYYHERSKDMDYTRYFDINQLPIGSYRLQIKHPKQTVNFILTIKLKGERYSLRELK
ncbi:hypothetical protein WBJ53_19735 [Spirosoma sp. SC4-14]|uniref:hypothetical protein n=1 Tax=Spirosoma sp. SC4-14 TaxID=3128900 RepID=UPI0030D1869D